jgi:hypothetical protein
MNDQNPIDLDKERKLNQAIDQLAKFENTSVDLWPSIKKRIEPSSKLNLHGANQSQAQTVYNQKADATYSTSVVTNLFSSRWNSWAIAVSLLVCIGSVTYSLQQLDKADEVLAQAIQLQQNGATKANLESQTDFGADRVAYNETSAIHGEVNSSYYVHQVDQMEKEFKAAKASLMARISMNSANFDKALIKQIETELMEIERATLVLKKAMGRQQLDENFTNLLRVTYQQELTVLTQLAKLDTTI